MSYYYAPLSYFNLNMGISVSIKLSKEKKLQIFKTKRIQCRKLAPFENSKKKL